MIINVSPRTLNNEIPDLSLEKLQVALRLDPLISSPDTYTSHANLSEKKVEVHVHHHHHFSDLNGKTPPIKTNEKPKENSLPWIKVVVKIVRQMITYFSSFFQKDIAPQNDQPVVKGDQNMLIQNIAMFILGFLGGSIVSGIAIGGSKAFVMTVATVSAGGVLVNFASSFLDVIDRVFKITKNILFGLQEAWVELNQ